MPKYFVRLDDPEELRNLATTLFAPGDLLAEGRPMPFLPRTSPTVLVADLHKDELAAFQSSGAKIYADIEFHVLPPGDQAPEHAKYWEATSASEAAPMLAPGLPDVLQHIKAPVAWEKTTGEGVTIAIIDTGICGTLAEFPAAKRSAVDLATAYSGNHWSDVRGHGSMCATIAAGTNSSGGRFNGVAPGATVLAARSTLFSTDIYAIYDGLLDAKASGQIAGPLVVSNSYGSYVCAPPAGLPQDHPYLEIILAAIYDGVVVVFAAGNNHYDVLCNHDPSACEPNTIWGANSHELVLSVGTVNANESNQDSATPHANSSRGPGQWAQNHPKPDCVAPTYGEVVWGCGYRNMDWWGTSGACPQVAGLAALILAVNPALDPGQVADIIRGTCRALPAAPTCVGAGLIDCAAAVSAV